MARFSPLFDEYKNSEEFKKLNAPSAATNEKDNEDEDSKKDSDPKGFVKYNDLVSNIISL